VRYTVASPTRGFLPASRRCSSSAPTWLLEAGYGRGRKVDRVLVMTAVPGRIKAVMPVGIDRPRDLQMESTHEFIELRVKIWNSIQSEVERSMVRDHDDS
jgi:hypothetical protein